MPTSNPLHRPRVLLSWVVLVAAVLAAWEHVAHSTGRVGGPGRWAPAFFVAAVLASAGFVARANRKNSIYHAVTTPSRVAAAAAAVFVFAVAVVAFRPAMRLGLLSDDYVLLQWARANDFLPLQWEYLRPLPLAVWWLVDSLVPIGRTPTVLHLVNILGHALNAWLVWRLAYRLGLSGSASFAAAALFLLSPISVEPVVWSSGVFDVLQATFALALCLVITRRPDPGPRDQVLCVVLALLMLGTKETGVVAAPLAILAYSARWGRGARRGHTLIGVLAVIAVLYGVGRRATGHLDPRLMPVFDTESIDRLLTQSLAALSVPLHEQVIRGHPAIAVATGLGSIVVIAGWTFRWRRAPHGARLALLAAAALIVSIVPTVRSFGVLDDLQGSRYLYLGAAFWCVALGSALLDGWSTRLARAAGVCMAATAVTGAAAALHAHLAPWQAAARARQVVLRRLIALPPTCTHVHAAGIPDHVSGAYVFRNGLPQALAGLGRPYEFVGPDPAPQECRVDLNPALNAPAAPSGRRRRPTTDGPATSTGTSGPRTSTADRTPTPD